MPHLIQSGRSRWPGAARRSRLVVRTSDVVLAVTFVTLLGVLCLMLLANLIGASGGMAAGPNLDRAS